MAPSAHAPLGLRQNHTYASSTSHTKQAQLANAYSSLAEELSTDTLKVVGGYTLGKVIGEGTFGSVHIASHRLTGMRCAIKKVEKTATPQLTREIHHHRRLHHPHIVHLHEIIATENHIWLVFELCSGGELFDYLVERGRILEGEARRLFGELCTAVGWLHRQGIVHRDLKLENVLLDGELRVKLADLGFAREYQKGRLMETFCGTTGYASPEMLACQKYTGVETDVWSLGIILYTLLCGGLPFDDDDERVMKDLILKGEYEEPEWLTEEARSLIRGMLQKNPSDRLSMEGILTHPWFKTTLYDNLQNAASALSIPPSNPSSPIVHPSASSDNIARKRLSTSSAASFPFCPRASTSQVQLIVEEPAKLATSPEGESEPSETSFEFSDNTHGKATTSGDTSPTTAENEDEPDSARSPSGEFSKAERALELAHKNSSESTIRKTDQLRERLARMSLEGQREENESDVSSRADKRLSASSLPMIDELSLTLPVADHSRTPVRTKRRSLTSQLPLERKLSHHSVSSSSQWQAYVPDDYLALVNADLPPLFSTPSEKLLLDRLSSLGFDMGQLMHSVKTDACDSSSAMWWILRLKQLERGETDDAVHAKKERERRRRERARRKRDDKELSTAATLLKGSPTAAVDPSVARTSELLSTPRTTTVQSERPLSGHSAHSARSSHAPTTTAASNHTHSTHQDRPGSPTSTIPTIVAPSPSVEQSPSKETTRKSGRSQSINMLQRATSMLIPGIRKTDADHHLPTDKPSSEHREHRDTTPEPPESLHRIDSPTKLTNKLSVPSMPKMTKSESDPLMLNNIAAGTLSTDAQLQAPEMSPPRARSFHAASLENAEAGPSNTQTPGDTENKAPKKDSIWTQFRSMFNEDRRRRKREGPPPSKTPQVIPTRSNRPVMGRTNLPPPSASRRTSFEGSRPMFSHRSSSVNSRRSSMSNVVSPDFTINLNDGLYHTSLGRRASGRSARSFRSTGTETPTSDREGPSRAGSVHSRRGGSRRSSIRSPTMSSDGRIRMAPPSSPLHDYHRRSASGSASTRVRHIRVLHEAKSIRPASVASSTRSNASSRASSIILREEDSDEDVNLRRSISDEHRVRSPLSATAPIGRGKPPLRDVFSKKSDDEWESEDDEYACGLGQGAPSKSYGGYQSKWNGASVRPTAAMGGATNHGYEQGGAGNGAGGTPTTSRFTSGHKKKGAGAVAEAPDHATATTAPQQSSSSGSGSGSGSGRNTGRRGLPAARAAPAQIIEEEEEEDE